MLSPTLASCVPYFSDYGIIPSLVLLLVAKPLTYLLFVLCFRYRVSTGRKLSISAAICIAVLRSVFGLLFAYFYFLMVNMLSDPRGGSSAIAIAIALLSCERVLVWLAFGAWGVQLKGRRLWGWTLSGVGIDAAFDIGIYMTFQDYSLAPYLLVAAVAAFLIPLYVVGRRPSLRARFWAMHICKQCGYDQSANASDVCPECGTVQPPVFIDRQGRPSA